MKQKYFLICLLLCFAPLTILAQTFTQGNLTYTVISGTNVSVKAKDNNITTAHIPSSISNAGKIYTVAVIEERAFQSCGALTAVTIPNSITSILNSAFSTCTGLTAVTIPNSVTSIRDYVFYYCTALTSVTIPNSVTSIGNNAFSFCSKLNTLSIPNSVISIGRQAFFESSSLTSVTIPDSVISVEETAFGNCSKLTSVNIPNAVTSIKASTFSGCTSLTSIVIPNSVTSIEHYAFGECSKLTSVIIPGFVTNIEDLAFSGCSGLNSVTVLNPSPVIISPRVFEDVTIANVILIVPAGSEAAYKASDIWKDFKSVTTLSTIDFETDNKILIFPNPSTGVFNVETDQNDRLEIYDVLGKKIKSQKADAGISQIDLLGYNSGIYLLKAVTSSNQSKTVKLIKR